MGPGASGHSPRLRQLGPPSTRAISIHGLSPTQRPAFVCLEQGSFLLGRIAQKGFSSCRKLPRDFLASGLRLLFNSVPMAQEGGKLFLQKAPWCLMGSFPSPNWRG